jgi:predicted SnoaL-like aldol condensation-catalyzing enzyme
MQASPERNRRTVLAFYDALINRKDYQQARQHVGPRYIQHNPLWRDGVDGLRDLVEMLRRDFPQARSEIVRCFTDGDHVILHVRSTRAPDRPTRAIVDIFRLEDGLIAEHWDVIQEVPQTAANANGMFAAGAAA